MEQITNEHYSLVHRIARKAKRRLPGSIELDDLVSAGNLGLCDAATKFERRKGVPFGAYAQHRIRGSINDYLRTCHWFPRNSSDMYMTSLEEYEKSDEWDLELSLDLETAFDELDEKQRFVIERKLYGLTGVEIGDKLSVTESRTSQIYTSALKKMSKCIHAEPTLIPIHKPKLTIISGYSAMQNNLTDLNDLLFKQLTRLDNLDEKSGAEISSEIERAKAVTIVSTQVINNARLALDVAQFSETHKTHRIPKMLSAETPSLTVIDSGKSESQ